MKILSLLFRASLFLLFLGFAIKNDGMVTVKSFFDSSLQLPLVVVILVMFAAGALLGAMAMYARSVSLRRENERLRRSLPAPSTRLPSRSEDSAN